MSHAVWYTFSALRTSYALSDASYRTAWPQYNTRVSLRSMACKISRDLAKSPAISRRPQHALSHSSLLLGLAWFPGLPVSSHAPSARQRITHEPHAPGLGQRRPCCALAAPSLHRDHRRRRVAACHRRPYRALHVVPCRSCEPSGSLPITAATPAELLRSLRRGRAVKGRCALIHCWCEHVPRAHQMAAKRSAERRPSALLRHGQAARGQYWSLVRLPHRAAAVAA